MTKPTGLSQPLRAKLAGLTRRIRLLRAVRGLCLLTLALVLLLGGLFLIDALQPLAGGVLRGALLGIAAVTALAALFGLVVPLWRRHDPEALAALIEQRYPELGERLTSTVELAGGQDAWHGSRVLIELLSEETERRASPLDFTRAFPARATGWLALTALAALLLGAAPALVWGEHYAAFGNRLLAAWDSQSPQESEHAGTYAFEVAPRQDFAARGRPLELTVLVHAPHPDLAPATAAHLVYTDAQGKLIRVRMTAAPERMPAQGVGAIAQAAAPFGAIPLAGAANFLSGVGPRTRVFTHHFDRLAGDLNFRVEADGSQSASYRVAAIEPVELLPDSPVALVEAPPYANPEVHPPQTVPPLTGDLSAFEYGPVRLDFRFNRPAVAARVEINRRDGKSGRVVESWTLPVRLAPDRTQALFAVPSLRPDTYDLRLTLEAEHGIRTEHDLRPLLIRPDEPPLFATKPDVAGLKPAVARPGWAVGADPTGAQFKAVRLSVAADQAREVAPGDTLRFKVAVEDTVGVDRVELEFRINSGPSRFQEVVEGRGRLKAEPESEHSFRVPGDAREGDLVLFRFKAADNRRLARGVQRDADGRAVPRHDLTAHVTYYPEPQGGKDRWFILRINRKAEPLAKQEILAQRDQVRQKIDAIQKKLAAERGQLNKLRNDSRAQPQLSPEQQSGLRDLRRDNRAIQNDLQRLADETAETPALHPLTNAAEQLARNEMPRSEDALTQAQNRKKPANRRNEQLEKSDVELARAQKRLDALRQENEKLARARLDQLQLEQLARRQEELAKQAENLNAKKLPQDPQAQAELNKLRAEQNDVAEELRRLTEQSEALQGALKAAQAEKAKALAEKAKELAQAQRDLTEAAKETAQKEADAQFGELARKQKELADKAGQLARETANPARAAAKQPLRPEDAQKAAEALKQGDVGEALQKQDQAAREFERVANDLDAGAKLAKDPHEAARQLANLQEELRKRVLAERDRKDKVPLARRLEKFRPEQEALQQATKALEVPPAFREAKDAQKQAAERMQNAKQALQQNNPWWAESSMAQARQQLQRLADRLPSLAQRKQQALNQVADLKRQQQEVARQAEQIAKQAATKDPADPKQKAQLTKALADPARRQAQLAERLGKLEIPGEEARQQKAEQAMNQALNDLLEAQGQDVPASQQQAKRTLDRLEKALRGEQTVEEKARKLAVEQKKLAQEAARLAADPKKATPAQVKALQDKQQQLAAQAQALPAKEDAPLQAEQATKATKQAAEAAKAQPTQPATQQKMEKAAQALAKLADQLEGKEGDAARAERLAQEQNKLAAKAEQLAKKDPGKVTGAEAQQQQKRVADEAKQVRGGEEAQGEKKRAADALAKAQQGGQQPEQMAKAQRAAADALRDLADKLAGRTDAAAKAAELARQQRDLANEVAAPKKDPRPLRPEQKAEELAELARKAAQKQAALARQMERLQARGAEQAQKQAAQQMAAAQKALQNTKDPAAAKEALAKAAQAAEQLAKTLAQQQVTKPGNPKGGQHTAAKPGEQFPKQLAQKLAQQQKQLAQATQRAQQQAAGKPGQQGKEALQKALANIAKQQEQLNQQAGQLPANKAQTGLTKARQAMNQAQEALQKNNAGQARQKQQEAAQALDQLARNLPDKAPTPGQAQAAPKQPGATPQGLPTKAQADQARQLAQAQKDLRAEVQKLAAKVALTRPTQPTEQNPLAELARKQQAVAQQAAKLAQDIGKEQGQKAQVTKQAQATAQQAQQTAQKANAGNMPQAQKMGQQLAQGLRKLAQDLAQTPRGDNVSPKAPEPARQAAQLAKQQEELNRQMQAQAGNPAAQKAQQAAQQGELQKQTAALMQQFGKLGQETPAPQAKQAAAQAAQATNQAQQAMQQAQAQGKQGNPHKAGEAGKQAAQHLDRAAQQAAQAAQQMQGAPKPGQPQTASAAQKQAGKALQEGKEQVGQAQAKLGQGQPKQAQGAMQKAAQALQQAAAQAGQQLTEPKESGPPKQAKTPGVKGAAPGGLPDLSAFGKDLKKYEGRSWGELPGQLRTRLLQDMRARYGEDYAGIIQRYFEQIADTNRSRRR